MNTVVKSTPPHSDLEINSGLKLFAALKGIWLGTLPLIKAWDTRKAKGLCTSHLGLT